MKKLLSFIFLIFLIYSFGVSSAEVCPFKDGFIIIYHDIGYDKLFGYTYNDSKILYFNNSKTLMDITPISDYYFPELYHNIPYYYCGSTNNLTILSFGYFYFPKNGDGIVFLGVLVYTTKDNKINYTEKILWADVFYSVDDFDISPPACSSNEALLVYCYKMKADYPENILVLINNTNITELKKFEDDNYYTTFQHYIYQPIFIFTIYDSKAKKFYILDGRLSNTSFPLYSYYGGKIHFEDNITLPKYENISWECIDFYSINGTLYIVMKEYNYSFGSYIDKKPYLLLWRNKTIKIISNYSNPYYFAKIKGGEIPIEKSYLKRIFRDKYENIRITDLAYNNGMLLIETEENHKLHYYIIKNNSIEEIKLKNIIKLYKTKHTLWDDIKKTLEPKIYWIIHNWYVIVLVIAGLLWSLVLFYGKR
ncbi:conserved hypothetical protein [Methanocaldococcus vulcanius M7]|uniref:Uncharacterized protein n=1 Tax=Methanocaldococcus vulcanius (strain ATCC 700851 / DSM 12094 / M7) TaxID=579137 RepID=C9RDW6_METVM|nr:hypothetical protein [Methanocaldococcus vulcanius]ACX73495.1 conserved hypothetical protein [Methanocaldococcus vulcanius M7]